MAFWQQIFNRHRSGDGSQVITALVADILHDHRLVGEILLQLPRRFDDQFAATMGLAWERDQLVLKINPHQLQKMRRDEARILLEHEALHIVWQHPTRYARHRHPRMVAVATDVAVNQYLPTAPAGTATLAQLQRLLHRRIPAKLDSQDYLRLLEATTLEERERLAKAGINIEGSEKGERPPIGQGKPGVDSHIGWQARPGHPGNQQVRLAVIRKMLQHAWQQTPRRDRGLLPGGLVQQLQGHSVKSHTPLWQVILRQQIGKTAAGKQSSAARFNRRQPLRMDLLGQVSRLVPDVQVFVDNSGSVPDKEIRMALTAIAEMVRESRLQGWVYSFDAKVNGKGQRLRPGARLAPVRHGGGGTRFQSIFDYLQAHHVAKQGTVIVIITDGWGEATLRDHHYRNVYWLLTTKREQLSVTAPQRHVFELKEDD